IYLSLLGGALGWALFSINAFFAIAGIIANAISLKKWHKLSLVLYLLMGWSVIFAVKPLMDLIPPGGFALLLIGGLFYSFGVIFYNAKKPRFMHSVWHLFVLGGSTFHYFFVLFYIIYSGIT
ncbi:MAG: hemolysin III family protein, partial [Eubacteriales bacterium]|nr:hemolysin III family protein [Eubacteriales bacterium]